MRCSDWPSATEKTTVRRGRPLCRGEGAERLHGGGRPQAAEGLRREHPLILRAPRVRQDRDQGGDRVGSQFDERAAAVPMRPVREARERRLLDAIRGRRTGLLGEGRNGEN